MQLQSGTCPRRLAASSLSTVWPRSVLRAESSPEAQRWGEGPHPTSPFWSELPPLSPAGASAREMWSRAAEANLKVDPSPAGRRGWCGGGGERERENLPMASPLPAGSVPGLGPSLGLQVARELQAGLALRLKMLEVSGASRLGPGGWVPAGPGGAGLLCGSSAIVLGDGGLCPGLRAPALGLAG